MSDVQYTPPPTVREFIVDYRPSSLFYSFIVGPVGSGKTTGNFMKLIYMAGLQKRGADGVRRSRCVIVRNTAPQLKDTTIKSWEDWFVDGVAGKWHATDKVFDLKFGDVECEVLFRPLDTADDVKRVLSLEVTFAIIDEFIEVPRAIIDALSSRLGRYPSKRDGGATNWGMWGASNPSTEDNWWYDYLHDQDYVQRISLYEEGFAGRNKVLAMLKSPPPNSINIRYFHQPSGLGPDAENLENLPGGRDYYVNQAKNKTPAWISQYLEAQWGFSTAGTPVLASFNPRYHITTGLKYTPHLILGCGVDPGLGGMAWIFGQEDLYGRLLVIGEIGAINMGVERFIEDRAKPYIRSNFPDCQLVVAPDPAGSNRSQLDDKASVTRLIRKHFTVRELTNNRMSVRLQAMEHYTGKLTDIGPGLQIDKQRCPMLSRALGGGWRYEIIQKRAVDETLKPAPEKNAHSHYGDGFSYLCCHFYNQHSRRGTQPGLIDPTSSSRTPRARLVRYNFT